MNAGDLAKFQRVQHQTGISVRSEPMGAVLILNLGAQRVRRMAAKIEDGRQRFGRAVGDIKISGDVKPRQALKNNLFDAIGVAFQPSGNLRLQRSARWQRVQSQHFQQLPPQLRPLFLPILQASDVGQALQGDVSGDLFQLIRCLGMALRGGLLREQAG